MVFKNLTVFLISLLLVGSQTMGAGYLHKLVAPVLVGGTALLTNKKAIFCDSCDSSSDHEKKSLRYKMGIVENPDDLVLDSLRKSRTWWRHSTDWKHKILKPGEHQDTWGSIESGGNYGNAEFEIDNVGGNLSVVSTFNIQISSQNLAGIKFISNGMPIVMRQGTIHDTVLDQYSKCDYYFNINMRKPGRYLTCDNDQCINPICQQYIEAKKRREKDNNSWNISRPRCVDFESSLRVECTSNITIDKII